MTLSNYLCIWQCKSFLLKELLYTIRVNWGKSGMESKKLFASFEKKKDFSVIRLRCPLSIPRKNHVYTHQGNEVQVYSIFMQEISIACGAQTCLCLIFQSFASLPYLANQSHQLWGPPRGFWCQQGRMKLQLGINMKICVKCVKSQLMRFQAFLCNMQWNL